MDMKILINTAIWGNILMILVSGVILLAIPSQIENAAIGGSIGPRFVPTLMAGIVMAISVFKLIKELVTRAKKNMVEVELKEQARVGLAILSMICFYLAAMRWNIVIPAILLGCALLVIMRCRKKSYYAIVGVTGILLYLGAKYLIHIRF